VLSKLERLKELRKEGTIDEREFALLKEAIIKSMGSNKIS
jgi:hypothetical protein